MTKLQKIVYINGGFTTNDIEREKYDSIIISQEVGSNLYRRMSSFHDKLQNINLKRQVEDVNQLGILRYKTSYSKTSFRRGSFILYEKYSRQDVCHLLNWGKDLSSTMYGMKRVGNDVAIFVTYHKGKTREEKEYLDGKPDYADEFINNQIFRWDSQIGKGPESSYMNNVKEAAQKHMFIKKSDAEGTDFYYMGQFDIIDIKASRKRDNKGKMQDISKVEVRMKDTVREDILEYLRG